VGNWKTILRDPTLHFDNRSPVDLKDRFRTYYPDAYKKHYPNAKTHLSNKVRSTLPDGTQLFEKSRSKRRRPFTKEEDEALKEGYERYGTVWATIVKEYPVFQEQNRRSTDLRDRFRNAFPELYQLAGYKPRNSTKKKLAATASGSLGEGSSSGMMKRAATDDQLGTTSTGGPVRSRRRSHTNQGLLRGGTKSVPQSLACTEDEDSSAGEEDSGHVSPAGFRPHQTPVLSDDLPSSPIKKTDVSMPYDTEDEEMNMLTLDPLSEALTLPDLMSNHEGHSGNAWSSGVNTPTHSNHWSTAAGSPTSSHLSSDMLLNTHTSPFLQRRTDSVNPNNNMGMIGKSAWGTDWFSPNPRLDPSSNGVNSSAYVEHSSPASPFSFHQLNQGVLDRYDLFPTTMPSDFSSEVGVGDTHSTFSDELFQPSGFRGFTHHSSYAGDLIFGARTHQPQGFSSSALNGGGSFGFGSLGLTGIVSATQQTGVQHGQNAGIHPMQLHTPSMMGGMEDSGMGGGLGLDERGAQGGQGAGGAGTNADPVGIPLPESMDEDLREDVAMGNPGADRASPGHQRPPTQHEQEHQSQVQQRQHPQHQQQGQQQRKEVVEPSKAAPSAMVMEPFGLDDLVDLSNELHTTPPATPLTQPRPMRRSSGSMLHQFPSPGSLHARSVSVPPTEFRNSANGSGVADYEDGVAQHQQQQHQQMWPSRLTFSQDGMGGMVGMGRMGMFQQPSISQQLSQAEEMTGRERVNHHHHQQQQQQQQQGQVPHRNHHRSLSQNHLQMMSGGARGRGLGGPGLGLTGVGVGVGVAVGMGSSSELSSPNGHLSNLHLDDDEDDEQSESDPRPTTPTLASRHLLAVPSPASITPSLSSSSSSSHSHSISHSQQHSPVTDDPWKTFSIYGAGATPSQTSGSSDMYNLPFLDLHYYGHGGMGAGGMNGMLHHLPGAGEELGFMDAAGQMQQAHALDLAAAGGLRNAGLKSIDASSFGNFLGSGNTNAKPQVQVQGQGQGHGQGQVGMGHMRQQSAMGPPPPTGMLGRSQSHHRGQSAVVNPQELMMGSDNNKRKRASWDGRPV